MTVVLLGTTKRFIGAAADTKPTGVPAGSTFYAQDTGVSYITYDDGTNWVNTSDDAGGGGGGGGAATIADAADATQGAIADAVVAAGATGTLSAKLRRLTADMGTNIATLAAIAAQLPASLGIKTAANSLSVAPASDGIFPVIGSDVTATGTLGASGNTVTISTKGLATVLAEIDTGTLSGTVTWEATSDDTNWVSVQGESIAQLGLWAVTDATFPIRRLFAVGGYSQFRGRVSAYTSGTSNARLRGSVAPHLVRLGPGLISEVTGADAFSNSVGYGFTNNATARLLGMAPHLYNNGSWDRWRNTFSAVVLASGSRTTTQTGSDITTYNARALKIILDMTVVTSSPSVTVTIQGKSAAGVYYTLLLGAAITTISTNVYEVGVGLPVTANVSANTALPRIIRVLITANNANAGTYSCDYELCV